MDIREQIRRCAAEGRLSITWYADRRMVSRGIGTTDLVYALLRTRRCLPEAGEARWRVVGPLPDGSERTFIVVVGEELVVTGIY